MSSASLYGAASCLENVFAADGSQAAKSISLQEYWPLNVRKIVGKKHPYNSQQYPGVLP